MSQENGDRRSPFSSLPLGRRAPVAAHARRDEGVAAGLADGGDGAQDGRQVADPSAAGRDRNARPARHQGMQTQPFESLRDRRRHVHRRLARVDVVHELQKGAVVPHTVLSDIVGIIAAEPTTSLARSSFP